MDKFTHQDAEAHSQELGHPMLGEACIADAQAQQCVDAYVAAWNESDVERRLQMLAQVITEDCVYSDPTKYVRGRVAIVDYIRRAHPKRCRLFRSTAPFSHMKSSVHSPYAIDEVRIDQPSPI